MSSTDDHLYKLSEKDKETGIDAIEPLPSTNHIYIVRYRKGPIKVDLSIKDWSAKLKTESKDIEVPEPALTVALRQMHLIETEKLMEKATNRQQQKQTHAGGGSGSATGSEDGSSSDTQGWEKGFLGALDAEASLAPDKDSDAEKLINLLEAMKHEYFLDQYGQAFILAKSAMGSIGINEPINIHDEDFVEYATGLYYDSYENVIIPPQVKSASTILSYKAKRNINPTTGEVITHPLFVRVAWKDKNTKDTIYIDACDSKRHIIVIEKGKGFYVTTQDKIAPIFRRQHRLALPIPTQDYTDETMNEFLDMYHMTPRSKYKNKRVMETSLTGMSMVPGIPHPIELPYGSKGAIKSSWVEARKLLIDPSVGLTLTIPTTEEDFTLQAYNNYMIVYDNVKAKNVPSWLPDALCRYVYEQSTEKRQLYSNMKTVAFGASGCAIVAGINQMFEEEDLMDRCVTSEWHRLQEGQYLPKEESDKRFSDLRPKLFGYLCQKTSEALAIYDQVKVELQKNMTRMADFMVWGECFARVCGYKPYEFVKAYKNKLALQDVEVVQNSLVGKVLVSFVNQRYSKPVKDRRQYGTVVDMKVSPEIAEAERLRNNEKPLIVFEKSINELYKELSALAMQAPFNVDIHKSRGWPKNPQKLSHDIRLIQSNLVDGFGIIVELYLDTDGTVTGHKNRSVARIIKDPKAGSTDDLASDDKPPTAGGGGKAGKGSNASKGRNDKTDTSPGTEGEGRVVAVAAGAPSPASSGGMEVSDGSEKVLSNHALHALLALPILEHSYSNSKASKASKATSAKTILEVPRPTLVDDEEEDQDQTIDDIIKSAPTLDDVRSLVTFQNIEKLHPVCKSLAFLDWEYEDNESGNVYLFAYIDTEGNQGTLHANDFSDLKLFAETVNGIIERYDYSCTWWGRGQNSDRLSDLDQWRFFCQKVGAYQIVEATSDYNRYPTIRSTINEKHRHIDAHSIHSQSFIKSSFYKGILQGLKLEEVHEALFPERKMGKLPGVHGGNVGELPPDIQKAYCLRDAQMLFEIMIRLNGQLLGIMYVISEYVGKEVEYVCHSGDMGYLVAPVLQKMDYSAVDPANWWDDTYTGGLVQKPIRGRHKHAMGVDCVGMYPEIVINYNISTETVCCTCCQDDPKARERAISGDPELDNKGYWLCVRNDPGLFPTFMQALKAKRKHFKMLRDAEPEGSEIYEQYDTAQLAIKIYMNASYGCFGFGGFQYRDKRVAELITGIGRKFATGAKVLAENKAGFNCIYGDTDGLLLVQKEDSFTDQTFTKENVKAKVKPLLDECYLQFNLPIDNDRNFLEVTPVEKKQYFGIVVVDEKTGKKKVVIKGLEGMKRDACKFNRIQFKKLMDNYLQGVDPIPEIKKGLETLMKGPLKRSDLAISATLSKDADAYPESSPLGKVARYHNAKKGEVVKYFLTGQKGNAYSPNFQDVNVLKYKDEHLTDIGKVLHAMGYDIDALYGPEFRASDKLKKRQMKNDKKNNNTTAREVE